MANGDHISFGDYESMCEQGSLTAIVAVFIVTVVVLFRFWLHYRIIDKNENGKHTIALEETGNGTDEELDRVIPHFLDSKFIVPFVPTSMESFVFILFFLWFVMTITMGMTRYYRQIWAHEFSSQQGPLNVIVGMLTGRCKGLDITAMVYTSELDTPPWTKGHWAEYTKVRSLDNMDNILFFHLCGGMLWLTVGFMQIYWANNGWSNDKKKNGKAHKVFGRFVALPAFAIHMFFTSRIVYNNPVNQTPLITTQYVFTFIDSIVLAVMGVVKIKKANKLWEEASKAKSGSDKQKELITKGNTAKARHIMRMTSCFIESLFGSGAIRITAWFLWLLGKFLSPHWQNRIDRGTCQMATGDEFGSAEHCWVPVYLNLILTEVLLLWISILFMEIKEIHVSKSDYLTVKIKFTSMLIMASIYIPALLYEPIEAIAKPFAYVFGFLLRVNSVWYMLGEEPTGTKSFINTVRAALRRILPFDTPLKGDDPKKDD